MTRVNWPRPLAKFLESPASIRNTLRVIVAASLVTTLLGGVLMWLFDHEEFPSLGTAMWWSVQTVTTVGYGDVTPTTGVGRVIGSVFLMYSVAFMAVLVAAITAIFIEHARHERAPTPARPETAAVLDRLEEISARLDRLERSLEARETPEHQ